MRYPNADTLHHLRQAGVERYLRLSDDRLAELADAVRAYRLREGESLGLLLPSTSYVMLVGGPVAAAREDRAATLEAGTHPAIFGAGAISLVAKGESLVFVVETDVVDFLSGWQELTASAETSGSEAFRRLQRLRHARAFRRVPMECVEAAIDRMVPRVVRAGDEIVRQGEAGDAFYMIWSGEAEVWRADLYDDAPVKVAVLGPGDSFGDESLLTGATRNASVRMVSDGELLVLEPEAYRALLARPLIEEVPAAVARGYVAEGAQWLDVRYEEEFSERRIAGAKLLPLHELRHRAGDELDPSVRYVVYCRSGRRSSVAALLLAQRNFDVVALRGGLLDWDSELEGVAV